MNCSKSNQRLASAATTTGALGVKGFLNALYIMTKPTITLLVVVTTLPGIFAAATTLPSVQLIFATLLGTALSSASAAVFNQIIDARIDRHMTRTQRRPLPLGRVSPIFAIIYGFSLGIAGSAILCAAASPLAAGVAVAANAFYVLIYTLVLKRLTVQNIVIGGAAGAVGPLIGWAAVTNELGAPAWALFMLIFLWTPPHFWALAIKYKDDYATANIPMLPVVKGDAITRRDIFLYSLTLLPCALSFYYFNLTTMLTFAICTVLTLVFVQKAFRLYKTGDNCHAMPLFHYSCIYLLVVFALIGVDRFVYLLVS